MRDITVARCTFDVGADMRSMVELHMRRFGVAVDTLPREVDPFFRHRRDLLNTRLVRRNCGVTNQAGVDAWQAGLWSLRHALVAILETGQPFLDVDVVRELDGLNRFRFHPEIVVHRGTERRASRSKERRTALRLGGVRSRLHRRWTVVEHTTTGDA